MFIYKLLNTTNWRFDKQTETNFTHYLVRAVRSKAANKPR